jgi:hypothetical protein
MHRLAGIAVVVILAVTGIATYFHFHPHQVPHFIRSSVPGFQVPEARSPMTNFRPPQFGQ